jgi:phosphate acetyltransferase
MSFSQTMKEKAIALQKSIVLPEGLEKRTLQAARKIMDEHIAKSVFVLGNEKEIHTLATELGLNIDDITIIDPLTSHSIEEYANEYYEMRKHKGMTLEKAHEVIVSPLYFGAMMVHLQHADAMVAGAVSTTGDVLRASFQIIKTKPGIKSASSCFVMETKESDLGANGSFIFSDCATIPDPTSEQLAEIAIASAISCQTYLNTTPVVAMLSYSTKGSASGPLVDKVVEATNIVKEREPSLIIDGELQLDAAIIESVGKSKAKDSPVAGKANTLIFPDLQAGNIGYKLVQRLAKAEAYGPILQGFAHPVSDLSRGCSVEDIVVTSAITLSQAQ